MEHNLPIDIYEEEKEIIYKYIDKNIIEKYFDVPVTDDEWEDFLDIIDAYVIGLMDKDYELTPAARELERLRDTIYFRNTED